MAKRQSDIYIQRAHLVARVSDGEAKVMSLRLRKAHDKVIQLINQDKWFKDKKSLDELKAKVVKILNDAYGYQVVKTESLSSQMTSKEITWNAATLSSMIDSDVNKPALEKAAKKAWGVKYQGKSFTTWFKRAGITDIRRTEKAITSGIG